MEAKVCLEYLSPSGFEPGWAAPDANTRPLTLLRHQLVFFEIIGSA